MSSSSASVSSRPETVGFIGLGNMGGPMAANLLAAGFPLVVHDSRPDAAAALAVAGAVVASEPAAVAAQVRCLCLSLPGPGETRAVFDALGEALRPGTLVIDFTTNDPLLIRELAARFVPRGVALVDAPVSGGVTGAHNRRLTVQVGAAAADFTRARPVLDAVADTVIHVGGVGAGDICKLLHNCAVFCADLAMVECLTAGIKAGVAPETIVEVFQRSGLGRNHDLHVALPARLFRGRFDPPHFALRTAIKDMGLATALARAVGVPMDLAARCEQEMRSAAARGWEGFDENIFLTLQEERAGVSVRLPAGPTT